MKHDAYFRMPSGTQAQEYFVVGRSVLCEAFECGVRIGAIGAEEGPLMADLEGSRSEVRHLATAMIERLADAR